ncbi:MAG: RNA repair domain-containing protein [Candidatus Thermoplasmatota archaeon]
METPRDVLNELKWRDEKSLEEAKIYYVHRGAPGDYRVMSGSEIEDLDRSFIKTDEAQIPYHRVFKIEYEEKVIFERERG